MAKLYFKYGAMGSSKSAQALITKFNYEERGMKVWLIKPATDDRDGVEVIKSRIGLRETAVAIKAEDSVLKHFLQCEQADVVIADECQFFTAAQIDELRYIVDQYDIPVLCFGLRTDFQTKLFPGSLRLFEVADSISEIKTICSCGSKAYSMQVGRGSVDLICGKCGGRLRISAATDEDLDRLCCQMKLEIRGK